MVLVKSLLFGALAASAAAKSAVIDLVPDNFDKVVQQEVVRLGALHPTPEDVPGCVTLFDDYLACNGEQYFQHFLD